jgi:hypothetical protein
MEAVRTSETSVDNHFTRQYIPEDNSEHHTRRRENLKSHMRDTLFLGRKHLLEGSKAMPARPFDKNRVKGKTLVY